MDNAHIKKMKKEDLLSLLNKTVEDCEKIRSSVQTFEKKENDINTAYSKIAGENGLISQIEAATSKAIENTEIIKKNYNEIYEDKEEKPSIKTQLDNLIKTFNEDKTQINNFKNIVFGHQKRNEAGEEENIPGLSHDIKTFYDEQIEKYNTFFSEQKDKYDELFKRIEAELSSGATSINLSKSFADKVKEYNNSSFWWSVAFMSLVAGTIIYYGIVTFSTTEIKNMVHGDLRKLKC